MTVVADAGPLLALAKTDGLDLLFRLSTRALSSHGSNGLMR